MRDDYRPILAMKTQQTVFAKIKIPADTLPRAVKKPDSKS